MDCCGLSSTGLQDIDANNIMADNISVLTSLTVSGTNILSSLSTINLNLSTVNSNLSTVNTNLSNINGFINSSTPGLNITGTTNINFNVGTQLTTINLTGLSVFHTAIM